MGNWLADFFSLAPTDRLASSLAGPSGVPGLHTVHSTVWALASYAGLLGSRGTYEQPAKGLSSLPQLRWVRPGGQNKLSSKLSRLVHLSLQFPESIEATMQLLPNPAALFPLPISRPPLSLSIEPSPQFLLWDQTHSTAEQHPSPESLVPFWKILLG